MRMRKKDLLSQNISLFDKLQRLQIELNRLKTELDAKNDRIAELEKQLEFDEFYAEEPFSVEINDVFDEPDLKEEINTIEIDDATDYGARTIGKIVVSASEHCNTLTVSAKPNCRELINLIMGKTELAKSEILDAVNTELSFEDKCKIIDSVYENTLEYFDGVMAQ